MRSGRARCWVLLLGAMCSCFVPGAAVTLHAAKDHIAERYDIRATVQADGSLVVEEEIAFRFTGGEYTFVNRTIPAKFTDGVEVLGAAMDGRDLPWGDDDEEVEVDYRRSDVRVRWHFPGTVDRTHTFTLRYRLTGVVRKGEGEDWLQWAPFPRRFDYPIRTGAVRLTWTGDMELRRQSHVEGAAASVTPIESGVVIAVSNHRQRDDDVVVTARFEQGAFMGAEPQWQRDEARASEMGPAFFAGAAMIAAATVLALWVFFLKYRRDRPDPLPTGHAISEPPEALPPALAGSITHGRLTITGAQALATVFDLAGRGVITIEEQPASGWLKSPRFVVRRGRETALAPHEQAVRDGLFTGKEQPPRLDKAMRGLAMKLGGFKKAMKQELGGLGYLDADRADGAKGLMVGGGVVMVFAVIIVMVLILTNLRLGKASLLIPAAFFASGVTMMIIGASFSTLSTRGWRAALRWNAYRRYLKTQAKEKRLPSSADDVSRLLPYATSLGLAPAWHKALKHVPEAAIPPWLSSMSATGGHAAYTALLASSASSAGGGGSSGGAGGAAGGGSSSAG